eukprot:TRINITY_DN120944_c0_g1_i1.p1 TRINITY_DN120944_c0_g1~~TRINITY_DN120944_c0_g1_i1.p1  ORF type:complete len:246 (+),score=58.29 TRINITY_DN120944_c0_g1_i1:66-803(+)
MAGLDGPPTAAAAGAPPKSETVTTSSGAVDVGLVAPRGKPSAVAICIHGKSPNVDVVYEWRPMADSLLERNIVTLMPNLHSCEKTAPATGAVADVQAALLEILAWAAAKYPELPVTIYGKSWGGLQATLLAKAAAAAAPEFSERVVGLVLACPSPGIEDLPGILAAVPLPTLLLWAQDDSTIPYAAHEAYLGPLRQRPGGDKLTVFCSIAAGGHKIVPFLQDEAAANKLLTWGDLAPLLRRVAGA